MCAKNNGQKKSKKFLTFFDLCGNIAIESQGKSKSKVINRFDKTEGFIIKHKEVIKGEYVRYNRGYDS